MSVMKLYDCKVGMRASDGPVVIHEAQKRGVTAPEVIVLQMIHGDDLVTEIRRSRMERVFSSKEERSRLESLYGKGKVKDTFGTRAAVLPTEVNVSEGFEEEEPVAEIAAKEPVEPTGRRGKQPIRVG